jgi:hypothetical protein
VKAQAEGLGHRFRRQGRRCGAALISPRQPAQRRERTRSPLPISKFQRFIKFLFSAFPNFCVCLSASSCQPCDGEFNRQEHRENKETPGNLNRERTERTEDGGNTRCQPWRLRSAGGERRIGRLLSRFFTLVLHSSFPDAPLPQCQAGQGHAMKQKRTMSCPLKRPKVSIVTLALLEFLCPGVRALRADNTSADFVCWCR